MEAAAKTVSVFSWADTGKVAAPQSNAADEKAGDKTRS